MTLGVKKGEGIPNLNLNEGVVNPLISPTAGTTLNNYRLIILFFIRQYKFVAGY